MSSFLIETLQAQPQNTLTELVGVDIIKWTSTAHSSAQHPDGLGQVLSNAIFYRLLSLPDLDSRRKYIVLLIQSLSNSVAAYETHTTVVTLRMLQSSAMDFIKRLEKAHGSEADLKVVKSVLSAIQFFLS